MTIKPFSFMLILLALLLPLAAIGQDAGKASLPPAEPAPRLVIDRTTHDFGELRRGQVVKTTFELVNEGDAPLIVRQIYPTCGCTAVLLKSRSLKPGERRPLTVTLDTAKKRGEISNPIAILTNDPKQPELKLFILADVRVYVELRPGRVRLTHVKPGEVAQADVRLHNNGTTPMKILGIDSSRPELSATPERLVIAPGQSARIAIRVAVPKQAGTRFSGRLMVRTDREHYKILRVPVTIEVWGGKHRLPRMDKRLNVPTPKPRN